MTAAEDYAQRFASMAEQRHRLVSEDEGGRWDRMAANFRQDPRRELDANAQRLAELIEPTDVVLDVGGGAGRVSLPLALRCGEVVNVDPSVGMCEQFTASAAEAGIQNARAIAAGWMDSHGVTGDVTLAFNVTYFIEDIVPFIEKLAATSSRRVVIGVWSEPPPNRDHELFEALTGEPKVKNPGPRELLPVLWEMGILPDIMVLSELSRPRAGLGPTRAEAIDTVVQQMRLSAADGGRARLEAIFNRFFAETPEGFRPTYGQSAREMLITWST